MIVDARLSNMWFGAPEKVELATGTAFSQIEVDQGPPIEVAGVDIADCFYNIGLPNEFRDLFALPPLRFGDLGLSALDFPQFDGKTQVFSLLQSCANGVHSCLVDLPAVSFGDRGFNEELS